MQADVAGAEKDAAARLRAEPDDVSLAEREHVADRQLDRADLGANLDLDGADRVAHGLTDLRVRRRSLADVELAAEPVCHGGDRAVRHEEGERR